MLLLESGLNNDIRPAHGAFVDNASNVIIRRFGNGPVTVGWALVSTGRTDERCFASRLGLLLLLGGSSVHRTHCLLLQGTAL